MSHVISSIASAALVVIALATFATEKYSSPFALSYAYASPVPSASVFTLGLGAPTLLSGDLTACVNVNASSCKGGLAAFVTHGRNLTDTGATDVLFLCPQIDVSTPFVQMHPNGLSVNIDVFRRAGIEHYMAYPSFFTQSIDYTRFYNTFDITPMVTNLEVPSGNRWKNRLTQYVVKTLPNGLRVCSTRTVQMEQAWVSDAASTLTATILDMRADNCDVVIVAAGDINYPYSRILPLLGSTLPDIFIDNSVSETSSGLTPYTVPNTTSTVLVGTVSVSSVGTFVSITLDNTSLGAASVITNTKIFSPDMSSLPNSLKDAEYYDFQAFLLQSSRLASSNDPVLAVALDGAAKSRVDNSYPCFGGECAQATLYTASYRWRYETDIGLTNSGGARGPGWAAGQSLKTSDVWALIPFTNYPCTGTMLGLKLWELANHSMHFCTFSDAYSTTASAFLQLAGVQIDYDNSSYAVQMKTRIRAIRIYDRATGTYKPLERLQYYTFATDAYQCTYADAATLLKPKYEGESVNAAAGDELVQTTIQEYLKVNDPYGPSLKKYLTNVPVTAAEAATAQDSGFMIWTQKAANCGDRERWAASLGSCMPCEEGMQRDSRDSSQCSPIPLVHDDDDSSSNLVAIVVPIVVVVFVLLVIAVCIVYFCSGQNVRNTKFAPKGDAAAIIFTDIQMSTKLWGTVPASMGFALDQHHTMIRAAIAHHGGYEVKTVGDSFMIAIGSAQAAVDLAQQIQLEFQAASWPRCIDQVYAAESNPELLDLVDDEPEDMSVEGIDKKGFAESHLTNIVAQIEEFSITGGEIESGKKPAPAISKHFHGIRVRIGIHYGPVEAIFDEVSKGYDYYGNTVNVAARIESAGDGGQIVVSRDVANRIESDDAKFRLELLGAAQLKGVVGPTELLQLTPVSLTGRVYTAKTMDKINDTGATNANEEGGERPSNSDNTSNSSVSQMQVSGKGGQVGPDGLPLLTEKESIIKETLTRCFKPLRKDARQKQIDVIVRAWHVRLPTTAAAKKLSEEGKTDCCLSVIAQRIGAVQNIHHLSQNHKRNNSQTGSSVGFVQSKNVGLNQSVNNNNNNTVSFNNTMKRSFQSATSPKNKAGASGRNDDVSSVTPKHPAGPTFISASPQHSNNPQEQSGVISNGNDQNHCSVVVYYTMDTSLHQPQSLPAVPLPTVPQSVPENV